MTDELYDYFGGNASKKVEPIEDDEFDNESEDDVVSEEVVELADEPEEKSNDDAKEAVGSDTGGKKSGHWDFLANMLGISSSKKAANETESTPVVESAAEEKKEVTAEVEEDAGMFGLDPISSPEKASVLSSMFTPGNDAEAIDAEASDPEDDLIGWSPRPRKSFISEVEESSADSNSGSSNGADAPTEEIEVLYEEGYGDVEVSEGEEVFEFEIEDLDPRPRTDEDDATHGRRRRKPARSEDPKENKSTSSRRGGGRSEKVSSQSESESRGDVKSDRSEEKEIDENRPEKPRRGRRPRRGPREGDRQQVAAERKAQPAAEAPAKRQVRDDSKGGFGAGLEDWDHDIDDSPAPARSESVSESDGDDSGTDRSESRPSGRKRRRRRGGSKSGSERTAVQTPESGGRPKSGGFGEGLLDDDDYGADLEADSSDEVVERKDRSREQRGEEGEGRSRRRGRTRRRKPANQSESGRDESSEDRDSRDEDDRDSRDEDDRD